MRSTCAPTSYADNPLDLIVHYRCFEHAILEHMRAEEDEILPVYEQYAFEEAQAIRATHDELRRQLFRMGIDVELHCVRAESLDRLVDTLRAHAADEDETMYPWAEAHLPLAAKRNLFVRIAHSLRALDRARRFTPPKPVLPASAPELVTHE